MDEQDEKRELADIEYLAWLDMFKITVAAVAGPIVGAATPKEAMSVAEFMADEAIRVMDKKLSDIRAKYGVVVAHP